jgi:zinc protease
VIYHKKLFSFIALVGICVSLFPGSLSAKEQKVLPLAHKHKKYTGVFSPTTFTLDNGLQVVVVENHRAPVIQQTIWYKVGSMDDPKGKSGLAHFLEHMMFKGTPDIPAGQYEAAIVHVGGEQNAFTTRDYTGYYARVAKEQLELVAELESGRMRGLAILPEKVENERSVILEERRWRTDSRPESLISQAAVATFYWHHPYKNPPIGWVHEIKGITQEDCLSFYKTYYVPNNAVLIYTGDITPVEAKQVAEKYFGTIPKGQPLPKVNIVEPPHQGANQRVNLRHSSVERPVWSRDYPAPHQNSGVGSEHAYALQVLSHILSAGPSSRLYKRFVDGNLAVSAGASYSAIARGPTSFSFEIVATDGTSMDQVEYEIEKTLHELLTTKLITADEVKKAKERMIAGLDYVRDDAFAGNQYFGPVLCAGLSVDYIEKWPRQISDVTVEQVNAAAQYVFANPDYHVTSLLLPEKQPVFAEDAQEKVEA